LKKKRNVKLKPNVLNFFKTGLIRRHSSVLNPILLKIFISNILKILTFPFEKLVNHVQVHVP